ncbi:hypothetical protein ACFLTL_00725 [Chloroflexota bacterium]
MLNQDANTDPSPVLFAVTGIPTKEPPVGVPKCTTPESQVISNVNEPMLMPDMFTVIVPVPPGGTEICGFKGVTGVTLVEPAYTIGLDARRMANTVKVKATCSLFITIANKPLYQFSTFCMWSTKVGQVRL